jgi:hypothetical protein
MAVQGPIPVDFAQAFPRGAYAAGEFEPVRDLEASKGLPGGLLWAVPGSNQGFALPLSYSPPGLALQTVGPALGPHDGHQGSDLGGPGRT